MGRAVRIVAVTVAVTIICGPSTVTQALPKRLESKVYKRALNFPVDLAWLPGSKKLFFTEKETGKVRVLIR